jgi:membrane-associated phospholipid phosphatase
LSLVAEAERGVETIALRVARPERPSVRTTARALSAAASRGRAWIVLSGTMAAHPRLRRAGRDGLAAWGAATGAAFAVKGVSRRRRPLLVRAIGAPTRSSSMPSSHTAGAVAYAAAATWRVPVTGAVVVPLALGVAWSRTATGRHFPTDVAVGAALGLLVGGAVHVAADRLIDEG